MTKDPTPDSSELLVSRGRDIWIRARTNAFAHHVAAVNYGRKADAGLALETLFVVTPIVVIALSLHFYTSGLRSEPVAAGLTLVDLGVLAIVGNGLALFVSLVRSQLSWSELSREHAHLQNSFQVLAQKARRLEGVVSTDEARFLCRHLEEMFELYKGTGPEPANRHFRKARGIIAEMNVLPFGISRDELRAAEDMRRSSRWWWVGSKRGTTSSPEN